MMMTKGIGPITRLEAPLAEPVLAVDVVTTLQGLQALQSDYQHLQRLTKNTLPFALFDWHLTWCEHFVNVSSRVRVEPLFHVVRAADGSCVAIIPLIATRRRLGPVEITNLDLLGPDPALTEIRKALIRPEFEEAAAQAVLGSLEKRQDINWIHWGGIDPAFSAVLARHTEREVMEPMLDYVLALPPSWDLLRAGLKRNIRESIRHCYNSLKRDGHEFRIAVALEPDEVRSALGRFFELHGRRAELQNTVTHPNHFATQGARKFMLDVCNRFAQQHTVRVFEMYVGEHLVASRLAFVVEDSLYLYYSGFDPNWGKYSVMTTTVTEIIKYAIGLGLNSINFSPGTDVSKTRWGPVAIPIEQAVQVRRSMLSQLAWAGFRKTRSTSKLRKLIARLPRKEWT